MKAFLILEDGTVFEGTQIGVSRDIISEIVFNTSMSGYQEVLTAPTYAGQAVCMTYPLIGNFGICREDLESDSTWVDGLIVRELSRIPSNFRCDMTIQQFMEENQVSGISGIDTRALTRHLREKGTMNGMITTNEKFDLNELLPQIKAYKAENVVQEASSKATTVILGSVALEDNGTIAGMVRFNQDDYKKGIREKAPATVKKLDGAGSKLAFWDFGAKKSFAPALAARGCQVTVYPATTKADEILADDPNGIFLSDGPGDPKECENIISEVRKIFDTDIPVFATGLGHEILALATGADTKKMKCGHRGCNYPVKDLESGKAYITTQNHGYVVDDASLDSSVCVPSFVNVNDGSNEGLRYIGKKIISVQFYPETGSAETDTCYLIEQFMKMMKGEN